MVHKIHKGYWSIYKSKWHHQKLEVAIPSSENDFKKILLYNLPLILPQSHINLRKVTEASELIK